MSSLNFSPPVKEEVCWTEKEALGLNIVVNEKIDVEDFTFNYEENDVFVMKDEEGEITFTLEEDEEEQTGDLINTSKYSEYHLIKQGH